MNKALHESQTQTQIAQQQLEFITRAWIFAEVTITGPLTFESDGMHIRDEVKASTLGLSPAIFVRIQPNIWTGRMQNSSTDPIEKKICPDHPFMPVGGTLFPKDTFRERFDIPIPFNIINKKGNYFFPQIIGCIEYPVTSSRSDTKRTILRLQSLSTQHSTHY